jgi:cell division inhibitor SepF
MAGVWRKALSYLGLVEDEELEAGEGMPEMREQDAPQAAPRAPRFRRVARQEPPVLPPEPRAPEHDEAIVRTIPQSRPSSGSSIHRAEPKRFNEARELGERFKDGVPVIMNLQGTEDTIARRLVDFASGLVFGLDGKIELVANRVYLLTPQEMEVSAEERERLRDSGFYNQF